jgi:hypothetical protein
LGTGGGAFAVSGLSLGIDYTVIATADDSAKSTTTSADLTTNAPPNVPVISDFSADRTTISGSINDCIDDGLPDPPSLCWQAVAAFLPGESCEDVPQGHGTAVPSNGSWTITGLEGEKAYWLYGAHNDGELFVCSENSEYSTPVSIEGCGRQWAVIRNRVSEPYWGSPDLVGARATWTVQEANAIDDAPTAMGFAGQVLWVFPNHYDPNSTAPAEWVEVGVITGRNLGPGVRGFYTARQKQSGDFDFHEFRDESNQIITPQVGFVHTFTAGSCNGTLDGCCDASAPGVWDCNIPELYPPTWASGCIDDDYLCKTWEDQGQPGSEWFDLGLESTCGQNRVNATYVSDVEWREGGTWRKPVNVNVTELKTINPPPPASMDAKRCYPLNVQQYRHRYWLNSETPTDVCP